jgi:putative ABC transport system permease protein
VDGVKSVTYGTWFGGIYIDAKHFFANEALEPKGFLDLYPEYVLRPDQKNAFILDRKGFIAGRKLVEKYGWKTGDTVTLKGTIFPGNWDFVMRGIYSGRTRNTEESAFIFHWDYLNETLKKTAPRRADQAGFYIIGLTDPNRAAEVSLAIDGMFRNSMAETITETEKAFHLGFLAMSEAILVAIRMLSMVVILIIMVVMANTMVMTARERMGEYAVFKTLGFGGGYIAGLILGESLLICLAGCMIAVVLTYPVADIFAAALSDFFPVFVVSRTTIYLDIAASVFVAVVAAVVPARRAMTLTIAQGLRRIG